jgi:hypothetical protein
MSTCRPHRFVTTTRLGVALVVLLPYAAAAPAGPLLLADGGTKPPRPPQSDAANPNGSIGRPATPDDWRHAEAELEAKGIKRGTDEFRYRMRVLRNIWDSKDTVEYPEEPEMEKRNEAFWTLRNDSYFVRDDRQPVDAINNLWTWKTSGIKCKKMALLILLKTRIDFASTEERARLNALLRGKVIPDDLPGDGEGLFFTRPLPRAGKGREFATGELLPGDQVWFNNAYFDRVDFRKLTPRQQEEYHGEEGSNIFYMGDGRFIRFYDGFVYTGLQYQLCMSVYYKSVVEATSSATLRASNDAPKSSQLTAEIARLKGVTFTALTDDQLQRAFPIQRVRRPIRGRIP